MKKVSTLKFIALLLIFALVSIMPLTAMAETDTNEKGTLSVVFRNDDAPIAGTVFHIYKVAEMQNFKYALVGDFADYSITLDNLSDVDSLSTLMTTLSAYIARDNIAPYADGVTDSNGELSIKDIEEGLYIGIGEPIQIGDTTYIPHPFMFSIPDSKYVTNPVFDVVVEPKYDLYKEETPETVERRVLKIWEDNDNKAGKRTSEITVQLLKNGDVYEEVVLNEENGWRHSWNDLSAEDQWLVIEKSVPDGYTLAVSQQGITFTLTNTYEDSDEPESTTKTDDTDTSEPTTKPNDDDSNTTTPTTTPNTPDKPNDSDSPSEPNLPQTGQLWWPVPVLLLAGILLGAMGFVLKKRSENPNA